MARIMGLTVEDELVHMGIGVIDEHADDTAHCGHIYRSSGNKHRINLRTEARCM